MWRLLPRQQAVVAIPPPPPVARRLLPKHRARRPAAAAAAALLVLAAMFMPRNMSSHSTVHVSRSAEISPVAILRADYVTKLGDDIAQNENLLRESDSHDTITSTDQQQRQQQTPPQKQHEDAKTGLVANIGKPELASAAARARLSLDDGALEEEGSTGGRGAGDVAQRDEQSISITSSQNIEKRTSHTGEVDAADVVDAVITADTGEEAEEGTETQRGSRVDSVRGYFAGLRGRGVAIRGGARLGAADLGGAFGLSYISGAEANKRALKRLRYHDITRDARYERLRREGELQNQNHVASYTALKRGYTFVYVGRTMRLSPLRRGCFASRSLRSGDLIGEYAGRYTAIDDVKDGEYMWKVPALKMIHDDGTSHDEIWGIDAIEAANELRFCNDLGPGTWNVAVRYVPWGGLWRVVFEATANVGENEELSVPYGMEYWARRRRQNLAST